MLIIAENDWRKRGQAWGLPLFQRDYFLRELRVGQRLAELARGYGNSLPQLAIAWVLGKPDSFRSTGGRAQRP